MKLEGEFTGITEHLLTFREEVKDAKKITFIGMPGVCSPFAELFSYVVRDKEAVFITGTDIKTARKIEMTPQGMQFGETADPSSEVVAILGGLAMPKSNIDPEEVNELIENVIMDNGKLMGLCYMDVFRDAGWHEVLDFDCIINATLEGFVLRK